MKEVLNQLSKEQIEFICDECSVTEEYLMGMDEDTLYDEVYEKMCDIEIDEVFDRDGEEDTKRCSMASDIVTLLGNTLE